MKEKGNNNPQCCENKHGTRHHANVISSGRVRGNNNIVPCYLIISKLSHTVQQGTDTSVYNNSTAFYEQNPWIVK